ncbi:MAG: hypothetical protein KQI62_10345 [Deltaproteobacteria bacterium]|nr:hypothetical protein [Deltaproteobacteria bacterium]
MRTKAALCLLALLAMLAVCPMAWAGPEMPPKLAAQFPQYPGSTVVDTTESPMILQAMLDCGSASEKEVYDFYKKQASTTGWQIMVERQVKGLRHLMITKGKTNGNIAVGSKNGRSSVAITLMKSMSK